MYIQHCMLFSSVFESVPVLALKGQSYYFEPRLKILLRTLKTNQVTLNTNRVTLKTNPVIFQFLT